MPVLAVLGWFGGEGCAAQICMAIQHCYDRIPPVHEPRHAVSGHHHIMYITSAYH